MVASSQTSISLRVCRYRALYHRASEFDRSDAWNTSILVVPETVQGSCREFRRIQVKCST